MLFIDEIYGALAGRTALAEQLDEISLAVRRDNGFPIDENTTTLLLGYTHYAQPHGTLGRKIVTGTTVQQVAAPAKPLKERILALTEQAVLFQNISHLTNRDAVLRLHDAVGKKGFGLEFGILLLKTLNLFLCNLYTFLQNLLGSHKNVIIIF